MAMFRGVDGPDSGQPHIQVSEKQALKVRMSWLITTKEITL